MRSNHKSIVYCLIPSGGMKGMGFQSGKFKLTKQSTFEFKMKGG